MTGSELEFPQPQTDRAARLSALVASRICHDLASPLGAIANGIELMELTGMKTAEGDLVGQSAASAVARMRFFRVAYGLSEPDQRIRRSEITGILAGVSHGGRLSFDWEVADDLPRLEAHVAFLILQCLETAMPFGGQVTVRRVDEALVAIGTGSRMQIDEALWRGLEAGRPSGLDRPSLVQFDLLPDLLVDLSRPLAVTLAADRIVAQF